MAEPINKSKQVTLSYPSSYRSRDCSYLPTAPDYFAEATYTLRYTDTASGAKNPKHKAQIRNCQDAGTPYTATKHRAIYMTGSMTRFAKVKCTLPGRKDYFYVVGGSGSRVFPVFGIVPGPSVRAKNEAKTSFVKKANETSHKLMGGTYIKEWKETIGGIISPFKGAQALVRHYLSSLKKSSRSIRSRKEADKVVSSSWLEFQFGLSPLLGDIEAAAQALAALKLAAPKTTVPIRGYGMDNSFVEYPTTASNFGLVTRQSKKYFYETSYQYTGRIKNSIEAPGTPTHLLELLGLNIRSFVPTIWELIPFSFVVDYFTNVGDMINGAFYATDRVVWVNLTERYKVTIVFDEKEISSDKNYDYNFSGDSWVTERTTIVRYPLLAESDTFVPELQYSFPGVYQQSNLLALGSQFQTVSRRFGSLPFL